MGQVSKELIANIIRIASTKIEGKASIVLVGSAASIVGYDTQKQTHDVDTYNSLKQDVINAWSEACKELSVTLTLGTTPVFTPPDTFQDRLHYSEISTDKIEVHYLDIYDFIISKMARRTDKDIMDIQAVALKTSIDPLKLVEIFFNDYLYVVSTKKPSWEIMSLKEVIELVFGSDTLEKVETKIQELTK